MTKCNFNSKSPLSIRRIRHMTNTGCCGLLLGLFSMATSCEAGMISHTFTGTVDGVTLMGTGSLPFHEGASVTGSYFYDDATVYSGTTSGFSLYNNAQTGVSFLVNGTYSYSHSQANPLYPIPSQNHVYLGAATNPPELIVYQTGSLDYRNDGLYTVGAYVEFGGKPGLLSSYAPSDISGETVDFSKVLLDTFTGALFQTYTYDNNGVFTDFRSFHVHLATVDSVALGTSAVPEPSSFALLGLGGIGIVIGTYRRKFAKKVA